MGDAGVGTAARWHRDAPQPELPCNEPEAEEPLARVGGLQLAGTAGFPTAGGADGHWP